MSALRQVFYVSRSRATEQDVQQILLTARRANAQQALTGALMHTGGWFAQVLEGPVQPLEQTLAAIARDPRHVQMRMLLDRPLPARQFADWTMGFVAAPGVEDLLPLLSEGPAPEPARIERLVAAMLRAMDAAAA